MSMGSDHQYTGRGFGMKRLIDKRGKKKAECNVLESE